MINSATAAVHQLHPFPAFRQEAAKPAREDESQAGTSDPEKVTALTEDEKTAVDQLKKTDREVRAHEQAHKNAGGKYAGSASFGYTRGPDGRRYATSGEVPIDISPVAGDPEATMAKMDAVVAAALAPSKPSAQDRSVAARAMSLRAEAQSELARNPAEESARRRQGTPDRQNQKIAPAVAAYETGAAIGADHKAAGNILNFIS